MSDAHSPGPPESVSPDDPIIHGLRWRAERDEARAEAERLREAFDDLRVGIAARVERAQSAEAEVERLRTWIDTVGMSGGNCCFAHGDQRWTVTIARHGATRPSRVVWEDMPGCYAWEAIAAAFAEDSWPEAWVYEGGEPFRVTVTVVERAA